jgi:hypothetical protein
LTLWRCTIPTMASWADDSSTSLRQLFTRLISVSKSRRR